MDPSPTFMEDLWVRQIFSAVGHTLLVYDYFLTLKDETRYIWNSPWTVVKVMFLINRYGNLLGQTVIRLEEAGFFTNISQAFCNHFAFFTSCFTILSTESIHILVLIRARAIWGTQKCPTNILIWSYVSYVLVLIGTGMYYSVLANHAQFLYIDVTHVCIKEITSSAWLISCGGFILDTILFVLTMRSLRRYSREFRHLYPFDLLHLLVRDAIIFFMASILGNALSTAMMFRTVYANSPKYFIAKTFTTPLLSVAGQRLVLNLRGLKGRSYTTQDLSCEVDRQLEAFAEADSPSGDDMGGPEGGRM